MLDSVYQVMEHQGVIQVVCNTQQMVAALLLWHTSMMPLQPWGWEQEQHHPELGLLPTLLHARNVMQHHPDRRASC